MDKKKVLVVDDDYANLKLSADILLRKYEKIFLASNGKEGWWNMATEENLPDLVISDVDMPQMGGFEFCRRIKEVFPKVKVILMSGYDVGEEALRAGADDFIQKPFEIKKFYSMIEKVMAE